MAAKQKVLALLTNLVPYHHARWTAFASSELYECTVAEIQRRDGFKVLELSDHTSSSYLRRTLLNAKSQDLATKPAGVPDLVRRTLDELRPQIVCLNGYSLPFNWAGLEWCLAQGAMPIICSESNEFDARRFWLTEWVKRVFVGNCVAGLAGGRQQADYLVKLGMPRERVFLGYDVVDNAHFREKAEEVRGPRSEVRGQRSEVRSRYGLPERYFLAVARFAEKKNFVRLIEACALYRKQAQVEKRREEIGDRKKEKVGIWDLVVLGDGPMRAEIEARIDELQVRDFVHLAGAQGYAELPAYYGLAGAFVHASTTEQWGLVVNEAMASGLPVLVSNRCGCVPDLVQEGVNGFTFDPYDVEALAQAMLRVWRMEDGELSRMGAASQRIIADWGPERFASGLKAAVDCALAVGPRKASVVDRMVLRVLGRRR